MLGKTPWAESVEVGRWVGRDQSKIKVQNLED